MPPEASVRAILNALAHGITAIDTAPAYADAERYVGYALKEWSGAAPFISSKAGRLKGYAPDEGHYDYSRDAMFRSVEESLTQLGVPVLDLLLLHDPQQVSEANSAAVVATMQELKEKGYARAIGIGGNPPDWVWPWLQQHVFEGLMEYNRLNACHTDALGGSLKFCEEQGIRYFAASPLHMGLLGKAYGSFIKAPPAWLSQQDIERARSLQEIAQEENMPLPALAHRFLLSLPHPFHIVTGASNPEELSATLAHFKAGPLPEGLSNKILKNSKVTYIT